MHLLVAIVKRLLPPIPPQREIDRLIRELASPGDGR